MLLELIHFTTAPTKALSIRVNSTERPAFPVETLIAAGIPRDATLQLSVSGVFYAYGKITDSKQLGRWPTHSEFSEIACEHERWEVRKVNVDSKGGEMTVGQSVEFDFKEGELEECMLAESHRHPIAIYSVWFSCGEVVHQSPLRVADLACVTYRGGLLWMAGESIDWKDSDFDSYPDYEVMADGHRFTPKDYWCYGGPKAEVFDGLMTLQQRARCHWGIIPRIEAGTVLLNLPERWADVARDFINRYGREAAEAIIGADNLDPLLQGVLWEQLTSVPVEDKRQLHLWPTESTHA